MSLKKRIIKQANSDNYSHMELTQLFENSVVSIFIMNILFTISLLILLALFILTLYQFFFNALLIEWNVLGLFISILLGIIGVLLGIFSLLMVQAKDIGEIIDSSKEEENE